MKLVNNLKIFQNTSNPLSRHFTSLLGSSINSKIILAGFGVANSFVYIYDQATYTWSLFELFSIREGNC